MKNHSIESHSASQAFTSVLSRRPPVVLARFGLALFVVIGLAILLGFFFRAVGLDVGMFRGESGLYLAFASASEEMQRDFVSHFVLTTYNGHFNPLIFWLEFQQAKLFQARGALWFWRQMLVLSMLGTALGWMAFNAFRVGGGKLLPAAVAGASVATFFIAQPIFLDLAMWPFMAFQFICLALMAVSAMFLMKFAESRKTQDLAGFLYSAYAAMHASGVGAAVSAAALATALILILIYHLDEGAGLRKTKSRIIVFAVAAIVTCGHGFIMVAGDHSTPGADVAIDALQGRTIMVDSYQEPPVKSPIALSQSAVRYGLLFEGSLDSSIRSLWANGGYVWPRFDVAKMQGAYGFGALLVFAFLAFGFLISYYKKKDSTDLVVFCITFFSLSCLVIYTGLVVFRLRTEADDAVLLNYFIGARYIIYPAFFIVVFSMGLGLRSVRVFPLASPLIAVAIALTAIIAEVVFAKTIMPSIWPHLTLNHQGAWNNAVHGARNELDQGQYVNNIDLSKFGGGLPMSLRSQQFLLEHQLGCSGCVKFATP